MNFKRIQSLWKDSAETRDGVTEEPSEIRFRQWILVIALLAGPPLLFMLYSKAMFPGLTSLEALDYAQLGRNLGAGRGFITFILRPLALTHGSNPLAQPEVIHGPLFPFFLALAFGIAGAKDTVAASVSGVFYVLTLPVLYMLGTRVFNRAVALLAALVYTCNALMLEYAASGLHNTLYIFLTTSLLLACYNMAAYARDQKDNEDRPTRPFPQSQYALAGLLTGLLYLTDPIFFWIAPFILGTAYAIAGRNKMRGLLACTAPMLLLMLPWMIRNGLVTGNPIFGLRGMEVWMWTKDHYPGYMAYRYFFPDLVPGVELFQAVVQKILLGVGGVIQGFPQITASWVLAFFLPCLLFRFTDPATNVLRRTMMFCFLGLLVGSLAFSIDMPLFVCVVPVMLIFSVGYLLDLIKQAKLGRSAVAVVISLLTIAVIYPLLSDVILNEHTPPLKEVGAARALGKEAKPSEVVLSDNPWIIAWYADRPSVLMPEKDERIIDVRTQFTGTRWLFLTDQVRNYSPQWASIYQVFERWNTTYTEAIAKKESLDAISLSGKQFPLLSALNGFTTVAPATDTTLSVAIAKVPDSQIGMRPDTISPAGP